MVPVVGPPLGDDEGPISRGSAKAVTAEEVGIEPPPVGRKTRSKKAAAAAEEEDEEIPAWKKALKQLTDEEAG